MIYNLIITLLLISFSVGEHDKHGKDVQHGHGNGNGNGKHGKHHVKGSKLKHLNFIKKVGHRFQKAEKNVKQRVKNVKKRVKNAKKFCEKNPEAVACKAVKKVKTKFCKKHPKACETIKNVKKAKTTFCKKHPKACETAEKIKKAKQIFCKMHPERCEKLKQARVNFCKKHPELEKCGDVHVEKSGKTAHVLDAAPKGEEWDDVNKEKISLSRRHHEAKKKVGHRIHKKVKEEGKKLVHKKVKEAKKKAGKKVKEAGKKVVQKKLKKVKKKVVKKVKKKVVHHLCKRGLKKIFCKIGKFFKGKRATQLYYAQGQELPEPESKEDEEEKKEDFKKDLKHISRVWEKLKTKTSEWGVLFQEYHEIISRTKEYSRPVWRCDELRMHIGKLEEEIEKLKLESNDIVWWKSFKQKLTKHQQDCRSNEEKPDEDEKEPNKEDYTNSYPIEGYTAEEDYTTAKWKIGAILMVGAFIGFGGGVLLMKKVPDEHKYDDIETV